MVTERCSEGEEEIAVGTWLRNMATSVKRNREEEWLGFDAQARRRVFLSRFTLSAPGFGRNPGHPSIET